MMKVRNEEVLVTVKPPMALEALVVVLKENMLNFRGMIRITGISE